jgi:hypothetical protein
MAQQACNPISTRTFRHTVPSVFAEIKVGEKHHGSPTATKRKSEFKKESDPTGDPLVAMGVCRNNDIWRNAKYNMRTSDAN